MTDAAVGGPHHAATVAELGRVLTEAGYSEERLREAMGIQAGLGLPSMDAAVVRRRLGHEPLALLASLFLLGDELEMDHAERALAPIEPARLQAAGLLTRASGRVRSPLRIYPYEGLLLLADPEEDESPGPEAVMGPAPSPRTLAGVTVRRRVASALDLGCGGGVQALLAARHAEAVVGTDVSRRSLDFSAANAQLNGAAGLDLREGDWFEPVAGERFDLIVTNLPYVISPDIELVHRDNPYERDELARRIVAEVPGHLTDGGLGHVLCNWVHGAGDDPSEVPRAWAKGLGCDTLVLQYSSHEPLSYAASWNRPLQAHDPAAFEQTVDRWLAYYRETGIERIALGTIVLRKRSGGRPWFRAVEVQDAPSGLAGAQTDRILAAQDHLLALKGEDDLLREKFRPVEGQRVEQRLVHRAGRYAAEPAGLRLVPGIGVRARVDPRVVEVVMACDGSRPLGQLIAAATADLSPKEGPAVAAMCLATVRGLFELGLVTAGRRR